MIAANNKALIIFLSPVKKNTNIKNRTSAVMNPIETNIIRNNFISCLFCKDRDYLINFKN